MVNGEVLYDFQNNILNILELSSDSATLQLHLENCISEDIQRITLFKKETPESPEITSSLRWCESDLTNAQITVSGENIRWYTSASLEELVESGYSYNVSESDTLYVTQTLEGCESKPTMVIVEVERPPQAPELENYYQTCIGSQLLIKQTSDQFNWYDSNLNFLHSSGSLSFIGKELGVYDYYLTSTEGTCESLPLHIQIEVINYDEDDIFISNVVTPNGDGKNDYFFFKPFKGEACVGDFKRVKIFNRSGKEIYSSINRYFEWHPKKDLLGVYLFSLPYTFDLRIK